MPTMKKGDVWRGIELVEHAAREIDTYSITQPLGVCVGITPFNFPVMIPLVMIPKRCWAMR
jgi:malonate-semialdehyde dehydrogenase (acetylating)/methylmalonate-semialdehyde dehydrogenase